MAEKLKSMKLTATEAKDAASCTPSPSHTPRYPWGLSITLDEESLDKLGEDTMPAIGAELELHARVKVTSVSASESNNGKARSISLQITDMCLESDDDATDHAEVLFGAAK